MQVSKQKVIGFWRGWSIAVGCAIGSGIFMMPTLLAPYGIIGFGGWVMAGIGSILIALTMSRLVRRIPKTGGLYTYVHEGLGHFPGFIVAWTYWIACISAIAGISIAFVGYLGFFIPIINTSIIFSVICSMALVWIIIGLNIRSIEDSAKFQVISTFLKLLPLFFIIFLGATNISLENIPEFNPTDLHPFAVLAITTTLVMWSFIGIETATVPAENFIDPKKTIPRVLIASVITILVIYILVSIAISLIVPANELIKSSAPFALAATKILGVSGGAIIAIGALISTVGSLNANALTAGNIAFAAARDNLLPNKFLNTSKNGTPVFAFLITGVSASILLLMNYTKGMVAAFTFMAMLSTLSTLLAYALCAITDMIYTNNDGPNKNKTLALIMSFATLIYSLFTIWGAGAQIIYSGLILILLGMPIYFYMSR